jgi:hypothetical protein
MSEDDKIKILESLSESINAINESISFEANFPYRDNPATINEVDELIKLLPEIYLRALLLVYDIRTKCESPGQ